MYIYTQGVCIMLYIIQWFVNVIIILILPPMHSHRYIYIFPVDGYMDIYYCTLYKACIMITWQFHLSINWKKLSTCFLLYVWIYASVQMIGSLSTNEENYMEWPGGDKMNILLIVWRVFFLFLILRQMDFS